LKRQSLQSIVAAAFLAFACLSQGCKSSVPPLGSVLAQPLPDTVVSNFGNASLKVNPTLTGSFKGSFLDGSYAYKTDNGLVLTTPLFSASNPDPGASTYAMHLFGTYIDYANGGYPAFELECFPVANAAYNGGAGPMFDVSSFTGIQFNWCTGPTDNSNQYFFCLITARIAPQSIGGTGTCGSPGAVPCYDFLGNSLFGTGGNWFQLQLPFSSMGTQYSSGSPTNVTATDETQVLQLMWTNRSNNIAGNYTCDMWLDDIEFY
jgi:hypothetical protein